jgi:hypothetical protein
MYANLSTQTTPLTSNEEYISISMPAIGKDISEEVKEDSENDEEYPIFDSWFQRLVFFGQTFEKSDAPKNELKSRRGGYSKSGLITARFFTILFNLAGLLCSGANPSLMFWFGWFPMKYVHIIWLSGLAAILVSILGWIQFRNGEREAWDGHPLAMEGRNMDELLEHAITTLHRGRKRFFWLWPKYIDLEDFAISLVNPSHPNAATFALFSFVGPVWDTFCLYLVVFSSAFGLCFIILEVFILCIDGDFWTLGARILLVIVLTMPMGFIFLKLQYLNLGHLRECGWKVGIAKLSRELRKACFTESDAVFFTDSEATEHYRRQNLETCIKALFPEEENDTPEDLEKKLEVYIKPIMEDIVL